MGYGIRPAAAVFVVAMAFAGPATAECMTAEACAAMYQPLAAVDHETVAYPYDGQVFAGPEIVSESAKRAAEIRANGGRVLSGAEEIAPKFGPNEPAR